MMSNYEKLIQEVRKYKELDTLKRELMLKIVLKTKKAVLEDRKEEVNKLIDKLSLESEEHGQTNMSFHIDAWIEFREAINKLDK